MDLRFFIKKKGKKMHSTDVLSRPFDELHLYKFGIIIDICVEVYITSSPSPGPDAEVTNLKIK